MNHNEFGAEIRPLCFTEAQDRLLACGYPHLFRLVDGHPHGKKPLKHAEKAAYFAGGYRVDWPREVALRVARASLRPRFSKHGEVNGPDRAALEDETPLTVEEARAALALAMSRRGVDQYWRCVQLPLLLEAIVGTEPVVDAILSELEALPIERFVVDKRDLLIARIAFQTGFLLERLLPERREHHLGRLRALHEAKVRAKAEGLGNGNDLSADIEKIVLGSQSVTCGGSYEYIDRYAFWTDAPDRIHELARSKETVARSLDVRFVYIAGPRVLEDLAIKTSADDIPAFIEDIGMIRHPATVKLILDFIGKKSAKDLPMTWMREHADYARPILAGIAARTGANAERAAIVLDAIGRGDATPAPTESKTAESKTAEAKRAEAPAPTVPVTDRVPPVLATPPWRAKRSSEPKPVAVSLPPGEPTLRFEPGDPDTFEPPSYLDSMSTEKAREWLGSAWSQLPVDYLLKLPEDEALERWNAAEKLWFAHHPRELVVALRRFGVAGLEGVLSFASRDFTRAEPVAERTRSARLAPLAARALGGKRHHAAAARWLERYPEEAALGLVADAVGKPTKARAAARGALRHLATAGHRAVVDAVADSAGTQARAITDAFLDRDPVDEVPAKLPKRPDFVTVAALPAPTVGGAPLPASAVDELVTMLTFTPADPPYAGVAAVREACDAPSLAAFAWELFSQWFAAGSPSKEVWAFHALGHFGDDGAARRLAPMVRAWPGQSAHARAVLGLDVLAMIGSDLSLMFIAGIAHAVKFKGIKTAAAERIEAIAEARGLSTEQLEDRLVPDLGLDADGSIALSFGPRAFRVVFDESLTPLVVGTDGKRQKKLPKPKATDDADAAAAAAARFKALKKDATAVAKTALGRLERAMCSERRWSPEEHRALFLEHPCMGWLTRRLIWGAFDAEGLRVTFRVNDEGQLAGVDDEALPPLGEVSVGIVHRLELSDELAARWGAVLGDYEIAQPFDQLGRSTFTRTDAEATAAELTRFVGKEVTSGAVRGLRERAWYEGPPQDSGGIWAYHKDVLTRAARDLRLPEPTSGGEGHPARVAVITSDPAAARVFLSPGLVPGAEIEQQTLGEVVLTPRADASGLGETFLPFGLLSPIAFSELVRDLDGL
ncbi:MAG: DUF4132 domain-containing protein [Sandaracinaceae bacterium]|nr:DUF4132 domain-containing protein [Sandaracinaceae bacterium]